MHLTSHSITWSSATRRIIIGCNRAIASGQQGFMRFLTVSHQARQVLHCSEAKGDADVGSLLSPVIEVGLPGHICTHRHWPQILLTVLFLCF